MGVGVTCPEEIPLADIYVNMLAAGVSTRHPSLVSFETECSL
jgi:hypothetical protein